MSLYKITLQLTEDSFLKPEYFIKRIVYLYKQNENSIAYNSKIINFSDIDDAQLSLVNSFGNLMPTASTVMMTNDDDEERVSFLTGNKLLVNYKGNQIPTPIKNNVLTLIAYLNSYVSV